MSALVHFDRNIIVCLNLTLGFQHSFAKPSSEGKAGVNVITEGSIKKADGEDSTSVCPDSVSWAVSVANDTSWVFAFSWDTASWFRTVDRCWTVSECWGIDNCSVIKYAAGDTRGKSWVDGILFEGGCDCIVFDLEFSGWTWSW